LDQLEEQIDKYLDPKIRFRDVAAFFESLERDSQLLLLDEVMSLREMSISNIAFNYLANPADQNDRGYEKFKHEFAIFERTQEQETKTWDVLKTIQMTWIKTHPVELKEYESFDGKMRARYWELIKRWFDRYCREELSL